MNLSVTDSSASTLSWTYQLSPEPNKKLVIKIKPFDHGYLVKVGCRSFAIESKESLIRQLTDYLNDPEAAQRKYFEEKKSK